jgi:lysophospholipase L1-like esterase
MTMYFQPDPNLRPTYGGGAIVLDGSGSQTTPTDMTCRWVARQLSIMKCGAEYNLRVGTATVPAAGAVWLYCSDADYTLISPHLTSAELASATTTAPTGFSANNTRPAFSPSSAKPNLIFVGDSITAGTGYGAADDTQTLPYQVVSRLTGYTGPTTIPVTRVYESRQFRVFNNGIGSSNFDNVVAPNNDFSRRWSFRRAQSLDTLALPTGVTNIMPVWLGTNDISYDNTVTGAICWARAQAFLAAIRAALGSSVKVVIATALKRSDASSPNDRLNDYNTLIRANWQTAGFDALVDVERLTVDNSGTYVAAPYYPHKIVTDGFGAAGVAANNNYYNGDGVHPTAYAYTLMAQVFANTLNTLL